MCSQYYLFILYSCIAVCCGAHITTEFLFATASSIFSFDIGFLSTRLGASLFIVIMHVIFSLQFVGECGLRFFEVEILSDVIL